MTRLMRVLSVGLAAFIGPLSLGPMPERGSFWSEEQFFAVVLPLMFVSAVLAGLAPRVALAAIVGAVIGAFVVVAIEVDRGQRSRGMSESLVAGGLLGILCRFAIDRQREKQKRRRMAAGEESRRNAPPPDDRRTDSDAKAPTSDIRYAFRLMMLSIAIATLFGLFALCISWLAGLACLLFGTLVGVILVSGFLAPLALRKLTSAWVPETRNGGSSC